MKIKLRYIIAVIALLSLASITYGFVIQENDPKLASRFIGFGTVGLFLIAMPLFLIKESKGKKMKDYMLNEENIRKMRETRDKKADNQ